MKICKTIAINFILLFFFLGLLSAGPSMLKMLYRAINPKVAAPLGFSEEIRKNYPWYDMHEKELQEVGTGYKDFIVMQHRPFTGKTINVDKNGVRYTKPSAIESNGNRYLFFGASLIWGYGATDDLTIPSIFSHINQAVSCNYGVLSAGVRQLLALLTNYYIENKIKGDKKNIIIFNNGIMTALKLLHSNKIELSTIYQDMIQDALAIPLPLSPAFFLEPASQVVLKIKSEFKSSNEAKPRFDGFYEEAIEFTAEITVRSWLAAQSLSSTFGDDFFAVLPPTSVTGHPYLEHLPRVCTEEEATFIRSVCKRIIAKIKEHPEIKFIDLTHIFDGDEPIYIDRFHYSPKGNRIYAEALTKQINAFTIRDASKRTKTHTPRKNESKRPYGATNPTVQEGLTYVR